MVSQGARSYYSKQIVSSFSSNKLSLICFEISGAEMEKEDKITFVDFGNSGFSERRFSYPKVKIATFTAWPPVVQPSDYLKCQVAR